MAGYLPVGGVGGGGGSGVGFQVFTQFNNDPGVYADAAARDAYFGANPDELARLDADEFLVIKLLDNGSGEIAYQQRSGGNWVDTTSLVQGEPGPAGASGNSYFFASIAARDNFFNAGSNSQLLEFDLPVVVNEGATATTYYWNGPTAPVSYDNTLWRPASLRTAPGTLFLGAGGAAISSGNHFLNFKDADFENAVFLQSFFDDTGSEVPIYYELGPRFTFTVTDVFDTQLSDPVEMLLPATLNSMTRSFSVRPATSGELRIQAWSGADDTGPVILDSIYSVAPGDVGNVVSYEFENPLFGFSGDISFLRFSGIELFGGTQTVPFYSGQVTPWLEGDIHDSVIKPLVFIDSTSPRNLFFSKGGSDDNDGLTFYKPKLTIQAAIDAANALLPAPSELNPVQIEGLGYGTYNEVIDLPDGISLIAPNSSLLSTNNYTLSVGSNCVVELELVACDSTAEAAVRVINNNNVLVRVKFIVADGGFANGVQVTGDSSNVIFDVNEIACLGASSAGIFDNSSLGINRYYNVDVIRIEEVASVGIDFAPATITSNGVFNIGEIINESGGNAIGLRVSGGVANINANTIKATDVAVVSNSSTLNLNCNNADGNLTVSGFGNIIADITSHTGVTNFVGGFVKGRINNDFYGDHTIDGDVVATGTIEAGL